MELRVRVDGTQQLVCGVKLTTTCQDIVFALAHATQQAGRFIMIEKFRDTERLLSPNEQPLMTLQRWGSRMNEVEYILRKTNTYSPANNQQPPSQQQLRNAHLQQHPRQQSQQPQLIHPQHLQQSYQLQQPPPPPSNHLAHQLSLPSLQLPLQPTHHQPPQYHSNSNIHSHAIQSHPHSTPHLTPQPQLMPPTKLLTQISQQPRTQQQLQHQQQPQQQQQQQQLPQQQQHLVQQQIQQQLQQQHNNHHGQQHSSPSSQAYLDMLAKIEEQKKVLINQKNELERLDNEEDCDITPPEHLEYINRIKDEIKQLEELWNENQKQIKKLEKHDYEKQFQELKLEQTRMESEIREQREKLALYEIDIDICKEQTEQLEEELSKITIDNNNKLELKHCYPFEYHSMAV